MTQPRDHLTPSFSFGPRRRRNEPTAVRRPDRTAGLSPPPQAEPIPQATPTPQAPPDADAAETGDFVRWVGSSKATLAIVFTDIVSSVALGNKLGNAAMNALRRAHFAHARVIALRHGGYVVKTMGDSIMAAFRAATDALEFALTIHADPGDRRLHVRAGIHVGPVTVEPEDVYGATVNYAARVVGSTAGDEIRLSSEAKAHVDQQQGATQAVTRWHTHSGLDLKGFPGKHILWSIALR